MGIFFGRKKILDCPIPSDRRETIEGQFHWLMDKYDPARIRHARILTPHHTDFPINYNGDDQTAQDTLSIIAAAMHTPAGELQLNILDEGITLFKADNPFAATVVMEQDLSGGDDAKAGPRWTLDASQHCQLTIGRKILKRPDLLIAWLSHDLAQYKLLKDLAVRDNNESLTAIATILFGLGVFNANASGAAYANVAEWNKNEQGFLTQMEWGYALAFFASFRAEKEPAWAKFLSANIYADFRRSQTWLTQQIAPTN